MTHSGELTIADVATRIGVRQSTVRAYMTRGQIPAPSGHLGRTPYWTAAKVEPWIADYLRRKEYRGRHREDAR